MEIRNAMEIPALFPVRKSKKQKAEFREAVNACMENMGYSVSLEQGYLGACNVVAGDPENAKYLITAHYDTCARMIVPNLITPCNFLLFMLYQILISVLILLVPLVVAVPIGMLVNDFFAGYIVWLVLVFLMIVMMMIGPANPSNVNDNTSGVVSVLEIAKSLPEKFRKDVCFVLFDLEEAGLIGSAAYRKAHKKATDHQLVLNLDCVGEGNYLYFYPTSKLKRDSKKMHLFDSVVGQYGKKSITVHRKGFGIYPSDQANFPYGMGICALNRNRLCLYLSRIHTPRDTILDETNVNILRAAIISMIGGAAAE